MIDGFSVSPITCVPITIGTLRGEVANGKHSLDENRHAYRVHEPYGTCIGRVAPLAKPYTQAGTRQAWRCWFTNRGGNVVWIDVPTLQRGIEIIWKGEV